jgi:hypothetical protein
MDPIVVEKVYLSAFGVGASQQSGNGPDMGTHFQGGFGAEIGTRFQGGYGMSVYQGGPYYYRQHGRGFGSILRGIGRFLLPILINGGTTAAGAFMQGRKEGKTVGESIKGALGPAAGEALRSGAEQVDKFVRGGGGGGGGDQHGRGRRHGRRRHGRHQKNVHRRPKKLYKTQSKHRRGRRSHAAAAAQLKKAFSAGGHRNHFNF